MTAYTEPRCLCIPVALQADANAVGHVLDPDTGGALSFRVGAAIGGQAPGSHLVCSMGMTPATAALIDSQDAAPLHAALQDLAAARGRDYALTLPVLQALRDAMQVHAGPLPEALALWGLQLVSEGEAS